MLEEIEPEYLQVIHEVAMKLPKEDQNVIWDLVSRVQFAAGFVKGMKSLQEKP